MREIVLVAGSIASQVQRCRRHHQGEVSAREGKVPTIGGRAIEMEDQVPGYGGQQIQINGGCQTHVRKSKEKHARQGNQGTNFEVRQLANGVGEGDQKIEISYRWQRWLNTENQ